MSGDTVLGHPRGQVPCGEQKLYLEPTWNPRFPSQNVMTRTEQQPGRIPAIPSPQGLSVTVAAVTLCLASATYLCFRA